MNKLLVIGAGEHGKVVAEAAEAAGVWGEICFIDQRFPQVSLCAHWNVVASDLLNCEQSSCEFVVAIGDNAVRLRVHDDALRAGFRPAVVVHPRATVSKYAQIGGGSVVLAGAVINIDAKVAKCGIINTGATVDHDCTIGAAVHISPGANIAGSVEIEELSWIGIGACVKHGIRIGARVTVGCGAAVVSDLSANRVYVGVPARPLKRD